MVGRRNFIVGMAPFQGRTVSFREGISSGCLSKLVVSQICVFLKSFSPCSSRVYGEFWKHPHLACHKKKVTVVPVVTWILAFCKLVLMDPQIQSSDVPGI